MRLTLRLLMGCGLNAFHDLIYLSSDTGRQSLRDKMSGTYVVKKRAAAEGRGGLVYANLFFMNMALVYREVKRPR